ncbi:energy-coupling factor transporter transmembrane component T [Treponema pedis]|uniref:Energy-coupling factor transporter transmembrane protein EcfT n=1 Tax=Treponema pedis TaxID=409322 RepID=A0A7S6WQQ5_9SPIR|nr:energy-coupling factor transporter transmembrane component T [Treponema pedis]QOW61593.1 energy-coupling factor transporter transmembrane protein EcfT [Treponema pedis]
MNAKKLILDPRTKLFLVIAMGASITIVVPLYVEILSILLFAVLFITNGQIKTAVKLTVFFLFLASLTYVPHHISFVRNIVLPISFMVRRFMMPIVAGKYLINSTPVGLLMNALEKLRLPYSLVITLAVMFRFFPTLSEEYAHIKNAMKMRGIGLNMLNIIRRPLLTLEYVMVPLISSASRIGDELAAAGHTKGVDAPFKKIRYKTAHFTAADAVISGYIIAVLAAAVFSRVAI